MEEQASYNEKKRTTMHILNPRAGKGTASQIRKRLKDSDECVHLSQTPEDTVAFIKNACEKEPNTCFTIYGGDGTVFRAVNSIMESGHNDTASLKIVPIGSGNDFVKSLKDLPSEICSDVMRVNGRYAINIVNMGFDCSVVVRTAKLKKHPLITGKMAYIMGVIGELAKKKPMQAKITITYSDGSEEVLEDKFLLIAVGNGQYYGGGFKATPGAKLDDGLLDVTIVKDVTRRTFIGIVGAYKKGKHIIDAQNCIVKPNCQSFVFYKRCVKIKIEGIERVCCDGEIFNEDSVEISVIPKAINLVLEKKKK